VVNTANDETWSCEHLQRRYRCRKVLEGLWPVNQAQPNWTVRRERELCCPERADGKRSDQVCHCTQNNYTLVQRCHRL